MEETLAKNPYAQFNDPEQLNFMMDSVQNRIQILERLLDGSLEGRLDKIYQIKLVEARTHLDQIQEIYEALTEGNCVSIEQVFSSNQAYESPIVLWFKEETESKSVLGPTITGDMIVKPEEYQQLMKNLEEKTKSFGLIRIKAVRAVDHNQEQLHYMQERGIPTCEIREIWLQ